jgi:hypothetical protein
MLLNCHLPLSLLKEGGFNLTSDNNLVLEVGIHLLPIILVDPRTIPLRQLTEGQRRVPFKINYLRIYFQFPKNFFKFKYAL